jgi:hypothetical protein
VENQRKMKNIKKGIVSSFKPEQSWTTHYFGDIAYEGEEYEVLLQYAQDEANKLKKSQDDGGEDEEEGENFTRVWYAPWKKVRKPSDRQRKVRHLDFR